MSLGFAAITFGDLYQYALDKGQDDSTGKGARQAERAVKNAVRMVGEERDWPWYRRWHRFILREKLEITGSPTPSVSPLAHSIVAGSGFWQAHHSAAGMGVPENGLSNWVFSESGGNDFYRVFDYDSVNAAAVICYSNDRFALSGVSSKALTLNAHKDRYLLPHNFKSLHSEPHEQDFIHRLQQVTPDYMLYLKKSWTVDSSDPVFYCIQTNQFTGRKELLLWPAPTRRESVDILVHVYPEVPTTSPANNGWANFSVDWNPNHPEVLYRAIDVQMALERDDPEGYAMAHKAYRHAAWIAKGADDDDVTTRVAGQGGQQWPRHTTKAQRSGHFIDVPQS